jgi:hypothetical protein
LQVCLNGLQEDQVGLDLVFFRGVSRELLDSINNMHAFRIIEAKIDFIIGLCFF